ncbi:hypothetical protein ACFQS2_08690 [Brachybacterium sp. GCM10030267]|uniref:hypothetical protein n=1 Tax=unclassified Brachybacterium TaxID=2623841 RepID=UPI00361DB828
MTDQNFTYAAGGGQAPVSKTKWIVQLVLSVVCLGNVVTLILAILGLVNADKDLATANKYYKWGWIAYAIGVVLWILGIIAYFVFIGAMIANTPTTY